MSAAETRAATANAKKRSASPIRRGIDRQDARGIKVAAIQKLQRFPPLRVPWFSTSNNWIARRWQCDLDKLPRHLLNR
jgi:hypothetical protein